MCAALQDSFVLAASVSTQRAIMGNQTLRERYIAPAGGFFYVTQSLRR